MCSPMKDSTRHFLSGNATLLSEEGIRLHLRGSCQRKLTEGVTIPEGAVSAG